MGDSQYWLDRIANHAKWLSNMLDGHSGQIPYPFQKSLDETASAIETILRKYVLFLEERGVLTRDVWLTANKEASPYVVGTILPGYDQHGYIANLRLPTSLARPGHAMKDPPSEDPSRISVAVFLATDDDEAIKRAFEAVDQLTVLMGYSGLENVETSYGSIFRRSWSRIKASLNSDEVKSRIVKGERALELVGLDLPQSQADLNSSNAVSQVVSSLAAIPEACVRVGSLLIVKYNGAVGPVILTRALTQLEIRVLEQYPEIQAHPRQVIEWLGSTISSGDIVEGEVG